MTDDNRYAPPKAVDVIVPDDDLGHLELAGRSTRLVAWFVDQILVNVSALYIFSFVMSSYRQKEEGKYFILLAVAFLVLSFLCFLLIHGYSLKKNGQTIGKQLTRIRISDLDGNVPSFTKVILLRYFPLSLFSPIAFTVFGAALSLLDILLIFLGDRRCLHDVLAGTKVVVKSKGHALHCRLELGLREKPTGALVAVFFFSLVVGDMLGYLDVTASG